MLYLKVENNIENETSQNKRLITTKLMSGELRVPIEE